MCEAVFLPDQPLPQVRFINYGIEPVGWDKRKRMAAMLAKSKSGQNTTQGIN
jgi:hypothetical protein